MMYYPIMSNTVSVTYVIFVAGGLALIVYKVLENLQPLMAAL